MDITTIQLLIRSLCLLMAFLTAGMILFPAIDGNSGKLLLRAYEEMGIVLRNSKNRLFDYEKLKAFLLRNGAQFHYGKWIGPISYMLLRVAAGGIGLTMGVFYAVWLGPVLAIMFFLLPDMLLIWMNRRDNEKMLPEIKLVYHAMSMQIKAGVYVMDALVECHGSVQKGRLHAALLTLSGDIALNADVTAAMEGFQARFDNRYIDTLCITVLQALESGQAIDLLSDIAEQIKDMEATVMNRKKGSLDRSITFYQLGILSAVLVVVLYACVVHMFAAAVSF